MIRGVTYNRYSSTMQREESIEAQLETNHHYAIKNNIEILKDYKDEAKTGKNDDREDFQQMLEDAKQGMFEVIICHKVDRFARNRIESAINKHTLMKLGVKVVFSGQAIDDSPEGQLMEGILESMAEYYSLNLAKETMKGLQINAEKCMFNGGYVPFGYNIDPVTKKYIINESEALYVQEIFKMYVNGSKYDNITSMLKNSGIKTRKGRDFTFNSLHDLLCNEKYAGIYTFNKRVSRTYDGKRNNHSKKSEDNIISIQGGVPQIIDTDTFVQVQNMMNLKRRATRKSKEIYLLSGLVFCGNCQKPYCGSRKHNGSGKVYAMYRCNGRCGAKEILKDDLDMYVLNQLIDNIFSKKALKTLSIKLNEYLKSKKTSDSKQMDIVKERIKEIETEQNNIISAIAKGYDQPIFKQKLSELEEEMKEAKYNIEILKVKLSAEEITPEQIDKKLKDQRKFILEKNVLEVKSFIDNYVESVIVYKDDIDLNLKFDSISI